MRNRILLLGAVAGFAAAVPVQPVFAYPGESRVLSGKAFEKYKSGDYEQAHTLYQQASDKAQDSAELKFNSADAAFKTGKVDDAEKTFRGVYDQDNPALNAAATYNLGVIEQNRAKPIIEKVRPGINLPPNAPQDQRDQLKKEMEEAASRLEAAQKQYREAIRHVPNDTDMKANYEIAERDLSLLRQRLEELKPPPDQQQKQDNQKKDQDQQKQQNQQKDNKQDQDNKQNQDQNKDKQDKDQQNQGQDQQKDQKDKQDQNKGQSGQSDQNKQQNGKNSDQKKDEDQQKTDQQSKPEATPTPTPTPTPGPGSSQQQNGDQKKDDQGNAQGNAGGGDKQEEPKLGQMGERDVERLLNSLPPENLRALQNALNIQQNAPEHDMDKDW